MHEYHYITLYEDQIARISFIMAPPLVDVDVNKGKLKIRPVRWIVLQLLPIN